VCAAGCKLSRRFREAAYDEGAEVGVFDCRRSIAGPEKHGYEQRGLEPVELNLAHGADTSVKAELDYP
jgi:hypothetical protein